MRAQYEQNICQEREAKEQEKRREIEIIKELLTGQLHTQEEIYKTTLAATIKSKEEQVQAIMKVYTNYYDFLIIGPRE